MNRILILALIGISSLVHAQHNYIKTCEGTWKGIMHIYRHGALRDSVAITLTIAPKAEAGVWTWRTEYHSTKMPMTKDYVLRVKDAAKKIYVTDEGGGLELTTYQQGAKLYNVFETAGVMLTSTYECLGKRIIFEVTSGKKEAGGHAEVVNFSVDNLQRAVLTQ
jgi:hypothetical protein